MHGDPENKARYILLRSEPGKFPVVADTSNDIYSGIDRLRASIEDFLYDDAEDTIYSIIDTLRGVVVENHRVQVVKRAVKV